MGIQIGIGLSTEKDVFRATQAAVMQAKSNIHTEKIDLAIVFSSIEFAAHPAFLKIASSLLGSARIVGCTGLGIISNTGVFKHGLAVMLLSFPEGIYFNTAYVKGISARPAVSAGGELGERLLYGFKNIRRDLSVIFSDGLLRDESSFLYGLQEKLGISFPLAGAAASDNLAFKKTSVYFNDEVFSDAACGVLWGGKLNFGLGVKHGWKPLGKPRYVTKSSGNIVYEIDKAPAAEIYKDYFASDLVQLRKELKRISILYPIGIYLQGEEEYLLRNIISMEDSGALVFQSDVPEGSLIRLMIGTKESCLAATAQAAEEVKNGLRGHASNFVFVFDSVSRYILLGRQANKELEIIKDRLGKDTPIIGIYTYGEEAPLKAVNYQGRAYFHNQTIAILGMGAY
ncbi:MAG: FIST N-terminal domain-containing protein [Candidatus Omnitrophota bacterium]